MIRTNKCPKKGDPVKEVEVSVVGFMVGQVIYINIYTPDKYQV